MNEDLLTKLLRRGMQTGDVPVELDDAAVDHWLNQETAELPNAIQASIKSKLKQRLQEAGLRRSGTAEPSSRPHRSADSRGSRRTGSLSCRRSGAT